MLTAGADGTARIWDFSQRRFAVEGQSYATSLDFNSDGGELVFADGHAEVLATETGERIATVDSPEPTQAAFFSPDDSSLSLAGADGRVRFFDLDAGELAGPTLDPGGGSYLFAADWSADATRMLTASFELPAKVYDPGSGELVRTLPKLGFTFDAAISPDGAEVAMVAGDHSVPIFDVESGERLRELEGHSDRLNQVCVLGRRELMITGSDDGDGSGVGRAHGRRAGDHRPRRPAGAGGRDLRGRRRGSPPRPPAASCGSGTPTLRSS